eukprot:g11641.t1
MRQLGLAGYFAVFLGAATGQNACLESKCGGTMINLAGCGLTNEDTPNLESCFTAGDDPIEIIYLHNNAISALPEDMFEGLDALKALYLGGNPLTGLDESLFDGLTSLQRLWVNGCGLTSLPEGLFDGLTALEQLYLHGNQLGRLPAGVFGDDLQALHHLDLRQNALVALPTADSFEKLPALSTLNLSANKLSSLSAGHFPENLEFLFLADNELGTGTIDAGAFEGLRSLQTLTLSNNNLGTLPAGLFEDLEALTVLGLAGNGNLQCVPSTVGSPFLTAGKILPTGFSAEGSCSCPGSDVCDDCVEGQLGYICTGCGEEAATCQVDRTCLECRIPATDLEKAAWDACLYKYGFGDTCSTLSATSCCFDELSDNECLLNSAFTEYSACRLEAISDSQCTSVLCISTETTAINTEQEEDTSAGVRSKNGLVGWNFGSAAIGIVSFVGIVAWA